MSSPQYQYGVPQQAPQHQPPPRRRASFGVQALIAVVVGALVGAGALFALRGVLPFTSDAQGGTVESIPEQCMFPEGDYELEDGVLVIYGEGESNRYFGNYACAFFTITGDMDAWHEFYYEWQVTFNYEATTFNGVEFSTTTHDEIPALQLEDVS